MRLLLRANAHRVAPDGSVEIAASPDTPRPERWQWHLRVRDAAAEDSSGTVTAAVGFRLTGQPAVLAVTADPGAVLPHAELVDLAQPVQLTRTERELMVLVAVTGHALAEGRHLLSPLDTLVLAGDDPFELQVEQASADAASVALVRLEPVGGGSVAWVP